MKNYPLEIENAGEDTYELISFGHHDKVEFARAMKAAYPTWPMGEPEHVWMVRAPRAGYSYVLHPCSKDHKRAIPVTWSSEDYSFEKIGAKDGE